MFEKLDKYIFDELYEDVINMLDPSKMERVKSPIFKNSDNISVSKTVSGITVKDGTNTYYFSMAQDKSAIYFDNLQFIKLPDIMNNMFELDNGVYSKRKDIYVFATLYANGGVYSIFDLKYDFSLESWQITLSNKMNSWLESRNLKYENMVEEDWMACYFDFKGIS